MQKLILVFCLGIFDFFKKKGALEDLLMERRRIAIKLSEAEKNFLQHKIDKDTFESISKESNSKLIRVEAEIDSAKHREISSEDKKIAQSVSVDKRKIISGLLGEKQKKLFEVKFAEKSYLKRKISEDVYKKISSEVKSEVIAIDSQIKAIYASEEISRLKENLRKGAIEIAKQEKLSDERKKQNYAAEMEEEIFEQANIAGQENDGTEGFEKKRFDFKSSKIKRANDDFAGVDDDGADSKYEKNSVISENGYGTADEKNIPRRLRRRN